MIEIVFSDSACGSLKVAQHYGEGKYQSVGIGVIVSHEDGSKPTKEEVEAARRKAKEKARLAWESVTPKAVHLIGKIFKGRTHLCGPR
ncbi:hypothetical protein [Desulfosporosinus sp. FKB]|uniref:hypothetical protein n=1 Tax=Desulfosporosinus sp. FKB TaxID=1969835 RepID=UPI001FA90A0C|nr:hypothetical protein [Desulfosporosinus sp. FKB]